MKAKLLSVLLGAMLASAGFVIAQQAAAPEVRRVVTGLDASGKAVIQYDSNVQLKSFRSPHPAGEMWVTDKSLPDFNFKEDRALTKVGLVPPENGTIFRIVQFMPNAAAVANMDINTMMKLAGDHAPKKGLPPRHPMMHRTRSLDYAIIMSGEIDMLMDEGEVHLKAGDVIVQQATNHAWLNRGTAPCRIAFILMDSREP